MVVAHSMERDPPHSGVGREVFNPAGNACRRLSVGSEPMSAAHGRTAAPAGPWPRADRQARTVVPDRCDASRQRRWCSGPANLSGDAGQGVCTPCIGEVWPPPVSAWRSGQQDSSKPRLAGSLGPNLEVVRKVFNDPIATIAPNPIRAADYTCQPLHGFSRHIAHKLSVS